jgi:16S rRNA (guanine966-N2)-methyltransferase
MRIISGKYKGRKLNSKLPTGTRPTQDAMRETIFNILNNYIEFDNLIVADVCAGAGMLGLEALSRGAKFAYFVDKSRKSIEYINNSIQLLHIPACNYQLNNLDAIQFLHHIYYKQSNTENMEWIDLLFLDPPYTTNIVNEVLWQIDKANIMSKNGIIIAETSIHSSLFTNNGWKIITERQFGASKVSFVSQMYL